MVKSEKQSDKLTNFIYVITLVLLNIVIPNITLKCMKIISQSRHKIYILSVHFPFIVSR